MVWAPVWNPYTGWTWMWIQNMFPVWQIVDSPREIPEDISASNRVVAAYI